MSALNSLKGPELIAIYNAVTGLSIARFVNRQTGISRTRGAIAEQGITEAQAFKAAGLDFAETIAQTAEKANANGTKSATGSDALGLAAWTAHLHAQSPETVSAVLDALIEWDAGNDTTADLREIQETSTTKAKVEAIMSYDPIAAEGGLLDFLVNNAVKARKILAPLGTLGIPAGLRRKSGEKAKPIVVPPSPPVTICPPATAKGAKISKGGKASPAKVAKHPVVADLAKAMKAAKPAKAAKAPVVSTSSTVVPTSTPPAATSPARYPDAETDGFVLQTVRDAGGCKVGVVRAAWGALAAPFARLAPTQQKGIIRRSVNRLVEAGKLARDGQRFEPAGK